MGSRLVLGQSCAIYLAFFSHAQIFFYFSLLPLGKRVQLAVILSVAQCTGESVSGSNLFKSFLKYV